MIQDIELIEEKLLEEMILLEKSFFDLGEDSGDENQDDVENKDTDTDNDLDNTEGDENNDANNVTIQFKLQLKIIFTSLKNMINLVKKLYIYDKDEFEDLYDQYNRFYGYIKDFILNFNDFDDTKKIKMIKLFRESFKLLNKKLYDRLQKI